MTALLVHRTYFGNLHLGRRLNKRTFEHTRTKKTSTNLRKRENGQDMCYSPTQCRDHVKDIGLVLFPLKMTFNVNRLPYKRFINVLIIFKLAMPFMGRRLRKWTLAHMRTAKIQTSLRICTVWSGSSLFAITIQKPC